MPYEEKAARWVFLAAVIIVAGFLTHLAGIW